MNGVPARIRTALTMGIDRQMLVTEAAIRLLLARLVLAFVPFARLAAAWGPLIPPGDRYQPGVPATMRQRRVARRVRWAIATAAPLMPFRAACVQQAVAARGMLERRGIPAVVHFGIGVGIGVGIEEGIGIESGVGRGVGRGSLAAGHAWVDADGVQVTGFPLDPALIELGRFVRCP